MTDLSVILVNWNAGLVLAECLRRVLPEVSALGGECIVVDNGSAERDLALLKREFPDLQVIANSLNLGFARAMNQGIKRSRGRYLLLLNPDAFIQAGSLRHIVSFMDAEPEVGILGPRIVNADGSTQGSARAFPGLATAFFGRSSLLSRFFPRNPFTRRQVFATINAPDEPQDVDWVSGACMFVRRCVLEEVGFLNERLFLYWEDADICWRAQRGGWRVVYYPQARVTHLVGVCSRQAPARSLIAFHRSAYCFYRTHVTRSAWDLRNAVAVAGLSLRLVVLLVWLLFRSLVRKGGRLGRALRKLNDTDREFIRPKASKSYSNTGD